MTRSPGWPPGPASEPRPPGAAITLLSAAADDPATATTWTRRLAYAILDGTLIPIDRVADQRPYYSGKHKRHGVNVQVTVDPAGRLVWASPAPPGAVHDLNAARTHDIIGALPRAGADVRRRRLPRRRRQYPDTLRVSPGA